MCEQGKEYVLFKSKMRKCKSMCPHIGELTFQKRAFSQKKPQHFLGNKNKNYRILPKIISLN